MTGGRAWSLARVLALVGAVLAAGPGTLGAQGIAGMAVGPDGEPLAGIPVVLHRVGGTGGAFVATDTTAENGTFRFEIETPDSAIYFAAVRYRDRLYVGPAARAGAEPITGYVLRVEPGSEAGAVGAALSAPRTGAVAPPAGRTPAGEDTGAILLVAFLALAAVATFMVAAPRYRRRRTRDALVEIAGIENRLADPGDAGDRGELESRRDALREQLSPRD